MSLCLFFDIASHKATAAVASDEHLHSLVERESVIRDDELPGFVEEALKQASASYADLTQCACTAGPGGFTSLRVAVTYANVLADQLSIPLAPVHLADVFSARCTEADTVWIHSTKKQEVFVRGVNEQSDRWSWPDPVHLSLSEALDSISVPHWCGELIEDHRQALQHKGMLEASMRKLADVLPALLQRLQYEERSIVPWYGRDW